MDAAVAARIGEMVGSTVVAADPVHGGEVSRAYRVDLDGGRRVFAKTHASPPSAEFFTAEAVGLGWLREAEAVAVPDVIAVADDRPAVLIIEWIDEGGVGPDEAAFGRSLAALHARELEVFGRADSRPTGTRALSNEPCGTWVEFYAERRLRPLARMALDQGVLDAVAAGELDRIIARLDELGGPAEPPARLHGDLWGGNRLVDSLGRSWLVDPAVHGGHREYDLAMMRLFGGFGSAAFDAYAEAWPLADGWRDRVELHQLAPLLVHAIKAGGSYVPATAAAIRRYR